MSVAGVASSWTVGGGGPMPVTAIENLGPTASAARDSVASDAPAAPADRCQMTPQAAIDRRQHRDSGDGRQTDCAAVHQALQQRRDGERRRAGKEGMGRGLASGHDEEARYSREGDGDDAQRHAQQRVSMGAPHDHRAYHRGERQAGAGDRLACGGGDRCRPHQRRGTDPGHAQAAGHRQHRLRLAAACRVHPRDGVAMVVDHPLHLRRVIGSEQQERAIVNVVFGQRLRLVKRMSAYSRKLPATAGRGSDAVPVNDVDDRRHQSADVRLARQREVDFIRRIVPVALNSQPAQ